MERQPIIVPVSAAAQKNEGSAYKSGPIYFNYKTGILFWRKQVGDFVQQGEAVCEVEADKKTAEFYAPVSGILQEQCKQDGDECTAGDILGYVAV